MKFHIGKINVDTFGMNHAVARIARLVKNCRGGSVFTPNVDHVILANENIHFASAYSRASITLADGMPIVWASRLLGPKIRERVAGSDLLYYVLRLAEKQYHNVYFLGSNPETMQRAVAKAKELYPDIRIVGTDSPIVSNNPSHLEVSQLMRRVAVTRPDIVIVALGAPKQEIFIDKALEYYPRCVMLGLGASLDFLAGDVVRAPLWMQKSGLEWLWRLCKEPKRLWKRYLRDFQFPFIVLRELVKKVTSC